jgi:hypothetical protein
MKRFILGAVVLGLIVFGPVAFAKGGGHAEHGGPHPNANAYEHANDNARFKRDSDWHAGDAAKKRKAAHHKKHRGDKDHVNSDDKDTDDTTVKNETAQ